MNLAIKGHATRGKEVIEILEMLGGKVNPWGVDNPNYIYCVINGAIFINTIENSKDFCVFTLEQFLEKFPYKVGDKVRVYKFESEVRINDMKWDGSEVQYEVFTNETEWYSAEELNKFNNLKRTKIMSIPETMKQITDIAENLIKIYIPKGYEFAGFDDDNQQVVFEKIGSQYPKFYHECYEVMNLPENKLITNGIYGYKAKLLSKFQQLLICRDAYWKIAGEQMGLGKSWEPKWEIDNVKYSILVVENEIRFGDNEEIQRLLVFPTEEIRDAFYKNFKDLIEECKELL